MWLILSLTLLISCLLKSPGVSIAVGIVFYFASSVISGILFAAINQLGMVEMESYQYDEFKYTSIR